MVTFHCHHTDIICSLQAQESTLQAMAASFGRYAFSSDDAREVASAIVKYSSEITDKTKEALVQALQDINENAVWHSVGENLNLTHDMLENGLVAGA